MDNRRFEINRDFLRDLYPSGGLRSGKTELTFFMLMAEMMRRNSVRPASALHSRIIDVVREKTCNVISYDDAAAIAQFMQDQNMTIDEFCEDYDHNIALVRLAN